MHIAKNALLVSFLLACSLMGSPALAATAPADIHGGVSANWSGYVANTGYYTAVGGTWTVPAVSASTRFASDAAWVGIGGISRSEDLIQAGTQAIVQNGDVSYQAWYETLPDDQQIIPLRVHAEDSITVSLTETSKNQWYLSFVDTTTGGRYSTTIAYASSHSSAEWIEEMPTIASGRAETYSPLDDFGAVTFKNGFTVDTGVPKTIASSGASTLTMTDDNNRVLASAGALSGNSFTVTRGTGATTLVPTRTYAASSAGTSTYRVYRYPHRVVVVWQFR